MLASFPRWLLRSWASTTVAPGYMYQMMERHGARLAAPEPLLARLPGGIKVHCNLRDHVQRHIYFQGVYEPIEAFLFTQLATPGAVVLDAGGNIGQYSLLASRAVGPTGRVITFEPVPQNHARLQQHLQMNNCTNVQLERAGLWHEATTIHLGLGEEFQGNNDGSFSVGFQGDITAPAFPFDDYVHQHSVPRLDL
ncbi:MAG: FkbM family methyltransferase, partial [Gemmataceae bacterium]